MKKDNPNNKMKSTKTYILRLSVTAVFAAFTLIATAYLKIPSVFGYIHLGDIFIIISCFFLPLELSLGVALIATMLADLIGGYVIYMPITILAKGVLAVFCSLAFVRKKHKSLWFVLLPVIGYVLHTVVYFVFEGFYYGWAGAVGNLAFGIIQPVASIVVSLIAIVVIMRVPSLMYVRSLMLLTRKTTKKLESDIKDSSNLYADFIKKDITNSETKDTDKTDIVSDSDEVVD